MQRDSYTYLWDALKAADRLAEFTKGKDFTNYQADAPCCGLPSSGSSRSLVKH